MNCPRCNSGEVVSILYGLPAGTMVDDARDGEVVLGGCIVTNYDPRWHCQACGHQWGRATAGNYEGADFVSDSQR